MFKENSHSYRIMALISMTGECSEKALSILIPHEPYRNKLVSNLVTQKMITRYQKNNLTGFRLARNSKKFLLEIAENRFGFFLQDGADYTMRRSPVPYRLRQHRISETLAMMEQSEIEIYRDNKNDIFEKNPKQTDKTTYSSFYLAKEVKSQPYLTRKIISSKMTGIWITENSAWLCYQSSQELFWWFNNIERRADTLMCSMLQTAGINIDENNLLLFGDTMEQVKKYLREDLMKKYIMKTSFRRFCFVQMDENGIFLIKLMNNNDMYEYLLSALAEDLHKKDHSFILNDGYNESGLPVLICIDCDLKRLITFKLQLDYAKCRGEVICFDFQAEGIKEFCGKNIDLMLVESDKIKEAFFQNS